jgi:hypothetical protein
MDIIRVAAVSLPAFVLALSALGADPLPERPDKSVGVADCASSTCHGSVRHYADSAIRQDEYLTWQRRDAHARAYRTLQTGRSRQITEKLGWGPPDQAEGCLVCHAHAVAAEQRGPRFSVADGIGCEACHGAAERWLGPHASGLKDEQERIALGMYPSWQPKARAQLCAGCHQGDLAHPMSHAIMAAGHPPLLFELDTFMALMPQHHEVDADYRARKDTQDPAANWLAGQLASARAYLTRLENVRADRSLFPELAVFDCDACHHSMSAARWRAGRSPSDAPGAVPLADSALLTLIAVAAEVDPALSTELARHWSALHSADPASPTSLRDRVISLRRSLETAKALQRPGALSEPAQIRGSLRRLIAAARGPQAANFSFAENLSMAVQVLGAALSARGEPLPDSFGPGVDALFNAVRDRDRFNPEAYGAALRTLEQSLR